MAVGEAFHRSAGHAAVVSRRESETALGLGHATQEVTIKASKDAQLLLLQVQALDSAVLQLAHRRRTLPELGELQRLAVENDELDDALVAAETAVSDLEADQARAEADLEPVRERLARNQKRIANGTVADPKALNSMVDEVEHLKKRIGDLEDAELEVMEALEEATATRDRRRAEAAVLAEREGDLTARRDEQLAVIDAEIAERRQDRDAARRPSCRLTCSPSTPRSPPRTVVSAPPSWSNGVAPAVGWRSTRRICATFLAASEDEVLRCEECGRILIRTDQSGI